MAFTQFGLLCYSLSALLLLSCANTDEFKDFVEVSLGSPNCPVTLPVYQCRQWTSVSAFQDTLYSGTFQYCRSCHGNGFAASDISRSHARVIEGDIPLEDYRRKIEAGHQWIPNTVAAVMGQEITSYLQRMREFDQNPGAYCKCSNW